MAEEIVNEAFSKKKEKKELIESYWAEANFWAMAVAESIKRKSLIEAQQDADRLVERLAWIDREMKKET